MSRKKNDGAFSGSAAVNSWRRLPSISSTVTSSARPRPSDSTTVGVSAPGRWMLAIASRRTVERGRGDAARSAMSSLGDQAQHDEHGSAATTKIDRDLAVVGGGDGERRERRAAATARRPRSAGADAAVRRDLVAKQGRDRHVMRAAERPQRERARGQHAVGERERELAGMQRRRERQRHARRRTPRRWRTAARRRHEPDRDADAASSMTSTKYIGKDARAGRAQRLHRRDHVALAVEIMLGRVGDADAADQQRRQADQREILGEALDVALELRRRIGAGADFPAGVGKSRAGRVGDRVGGGIARAAAGRRRR